MNYSLQVCSQLITKQMCCSQALKLIHHYDNIIINLFHAFQLKSMIELIHVVSRTQAFSLMAGLDLNIIQPDMKNTLLPSLSQNSAGIVLGSSHIISNIPKRLYLHLNLLKNIDPKCCPYLKISSSVMIVIAVLFHALVM